MLTHSHKQVCLRAPHLAHPEFHPGDRTRCVAGPWFHTDLSKAKWPELGAHREAAALFLVASRAGLCMSAAWPSSCAYINIEAWRGHTAYCSLPNASSLPQQGHKPAEAVPSQRQDPSRGPHPVPGPSHSQAHCSTQGLSFGTPSLPPRQMWGEDTHKHTLTG